MIALKEQLSQLKKQYLELNSNQIFLQNVSLERAEALPSRSALNQLSENLENTRESANAQKARNESALNTVAKLATRVAQHTGEFTQVTAALQTHSDSIKVTPDQVADMMPTASVTYKYEKTQIIATIQTYHPLSSHRVKMDFCLENPQNPLIVDVTVQPTDFPFQDIFGYGPAVTDYKFLVNELVGRILATIARRQEVQALLPTYDFNGLNEEAAGDLKNLSVSISNNTVLLTLSDDYPRSGSAQIRRIYRSDEVTEPWQQEKFDSTRLQANELKLSLTNLLNLLESQLFQE